MSIAGIIIGVLCSVFILAVVISALLNPVIRRMSIRHAVRWPGSTALVVFGTMIGTAMITGSLVVGDNVRDWVYRDVETRLGEVDQIVFLPDPRGLLDDRIRQTPDMAYFPLELSGEITEERMNEALREAGHEALVNGALPVIQQPVPARGLDSVNGDVTGAASEIMLLAMDWEQLPRFGNNPPDIAPPGKDGAVISQLLADTLNVAENDTIQVIVDGSTADFQIEAIASAQGITGYGGMGWEGIEGTVTISLDAGQELLAGREPVINSILISHVGAPVESHQHTSRVASELREVTTNLGQPGEFEIVPIKQYAVEGALWVPIMFLIFSSFVILAGIALTVNIYSSLAEERRTSMGITRALGMRRGHLVRMYLYEGLIYSLIAAVVGVLVGLGLAWLMFLGINHLLSFIEFDRFVVTPESLLVAALAGILISMVTVLITSMQTSHINIVAAMRGLAESTRVHRTRWMLIWPALTTLVAGGLSMIAISTDNVFALILGPASLFIGLGFLIRAIGLYAGYHRFQPGAILTVAFLAAMVYAWLTNEFSTVVQREHEATPLAFILVALVLIIGGISVIALNLSAMLKPLQLLSTRARRALPMTRMALAYPGAKPVRTSFTILMFTIVLFMVTLMHVMIGLFSSGMEDMGDSEFGGFSVLVFPNPANPLPDLEERIRTSDAPELAGVTGISGLRFASVILPEYPQADDASGGDQDNENATAPLREQLIGVDTVFLQQTKTGLVDRAPEFDTDADVWNAMIDNPDLVVVDEHYSSNVASRYRPALEPGDTLLLETAGSGTPVEKQVAGIMQPQFFWQTPIRGILMNASGIEDESDSAGSSPPVTYLLVLEPGFDDRAVSAAIEREFLESGVQATSLGNIIDEEEEFFGFLRIIQGFLGFGLFVGVAGLAVVATRAVHQRRRDIGTLRAVGFRRGMILGYFLIEVSVVALIGILLGTGIGSLSSIILFRYVLPEGHDIAFFYPTSAVILTGLLIFAVGLIFTILPAIRASRLSVVEALRPME